MGHEIEVLRSITLTSAIFNQEEHPCTPHSRLSEKMPRPDSMDLNALVRRVYESAGMKLSTPVVREMESADYAACRFEMDARRVVFRVAKTTPTKVGQFVTLWKRLQPNGAIAPIDASDPVDFVVVYSSNTVDRTNSLRLDNYQRRSM